jgi:hypothetical protein
VPKDKRVSTTRQRMVKRITRADKREYTEKLADEAEKNQL